MDNYKEGHENQNDNYFEPNRKILLRNAHMQHESSNIHYLEVMTNVSFS